MLLCTPSGACQKRRSITLKYDNYGHETCVVSITKHHHLVISYKPMIQLLTICANIRSCHTPTNMPGQSMPINPRIKHV